MTTLFATHSGKLIDFTNIRVSDICLDDIAHHLTGANRFGGSLPLNIRYSVASHSLNCLFIARKIFPKESTAFYKQVLLHDAAEAYLGDVVTGLKACMPQYRHIERIVEMLIEEKYNLGKINSTKVKFIDRRMFDTEVADLDIKHKYLYKTEDRVYFCDWKIKPDKYPEHIKALFLNTCKELDIHD